LESSRFFPFINLPFSTKKANNNGIGAGLSTKQLALSSKGNTSALSTKGDLSTKGGAQGLSAKSSRFSSRLANSLLPVSTTSALLLNEEELDTYQQIAFLQAGLIVVESDGGQSTSDPQV
jgi:hypothetical protein